MDHQICIGQETFLTTLLHDYIDRVLIYAPLVKGNGSSPLLVMITPVQYEARSLAGPASHDINSRLYYSRGVDIRHTVAMRENSFAIFKSY